ncbi:MAG TPA: exonuclease SbcCD subunit D [Streptosporangiaceae bacterium]|jgi:exonuclease SbcD
MRVMHTSDWHLGRSFHREDMLGAQGAYVDHLVDVVRSERVDLVVVSGDVYDRALPSVDAVALLHEALQRLRDTGVRTVLISGNHDSARRLGFGAGLMDAAGIHIRTDPEALDAPVECEDEYGPVVVYGIPYIEPELVRVPWGLGERSHTAALGHAMGRVRADLGKRPGGTRSIVLAHAFVTGGQASDSERDISVGGSAIVPAATFDGVDYAALGHLHGRQTLGDDGRVRYSGSPLAYSFSEEHQVKGGWLVEIGPSGIKDATFVEAPVPRPIARVRGRIDDMLTGGDWAAYEGHRLQVTLTDPVRPEAAMERLRERFPHTLVLAFEPEGGERLREGSWASRVAERSETEIALDFVAAMRGSEADGDERDLLFRAFEAVRQAEASG